MSATAWIVFLLAAGCAVTARAQVQQESDPLFSLLQGRWTGTATLDGVAHPCETTWDVVLGGAFLQGDVHISQGPAGSRPLLEAREMISPAGEGRYSYYVFSSKGTSGWGTLEGGGNSWVVTLQYSDGMKETGGIALDGGAVFDGTTTMVDPEGAVARTVRFVLRKARAQR